MITCGLCRVVHSVAAWNISELFHSISSGRPSDNRRSGNFPSAGINLGSCRRSMQDLKISKINWDHQGSIPVYTSFIIYDFCIYGGNMFITQPWATETLCNIFFLPWFFSSTSRVLPWPVPSILQNNLAEATRWVYGFNRYTYIDGPPNKRRSFVWTSNRQNFGQNQPPRGTQISRAIHYI